MAIANLAEGPFDGVLECSAQTLTRGHDRRRITYWRSAAGLLAGKLEAPGSMPNSTMDRLEGAVAGQLQCLDSHAGPLLRLLRVE